MIPRHPSVKFYLTAVLDKVYRHHPSIWADFEYRLSSLVSIAKKSYRQVDVVLLKANAADIETGCGEPPPYQGIKQMTEWNGIGFEIKTQRALKPGGIEPFKATAQLIDYKWAGFMPVIVAPRRLLEKEREGVSLEERVEEIGGACLEVQLDRLGGTAETVEQSILDYKITFSPGEHFRDRVNRQLELSPELNGVFAAIEAGEASEPWQKTLNQEALRRKLTRIVPRRWRIWHR